MRKWILLFLLLFPLTVSAEPIYDAADGVSREGLSHVEEILSGFSFREAAASLSKGADTGFLSSIWRGVCRFVFGEVRVSLAAPLSAAAIAILCGLLGRIGGGHGAGEMGFFLAYAAAVGLAAAASGAAVDMAQRAAEDMSTFTAAALPALSVLSISSGSGAAAAMHPALLAASAGSSLLVTRIGLPAISISLALSVLGNLSPHSPLRTLAATIRRAALWTVCGSLTLFSAILSVTGYAAGTLDGVAMRGLKYAAGSLVPVLGSLLSESVEAVSLSAITVKNAAGAAGILFVLLLTLYPVVKTAITALLYRLASSVAAHAADGRISRALADMADVLAAISGMTAACGVLAMLSLGMLTRFSDMGVMLR